jgi:hypothetical protein
MIRVHLTQCSYSKPGGESHGCFNQANLYGETFEEALEALEREYGIVPPKKPKGVYIDLKEGGTRQVGFMHHRWQDIYDRSLPRPKKYWEENWVSFSEETRKPVDLPKALLAAY